MKSKGVKEPVNGKDKTEENFYERLPRFVSDQPTEAAGEDLPPIKRIVEYDEQQFVLTIFPAKVIVNAEDNNGFKSHSRLPGDFEQRLEEALRLLATAENINYDQESHVLVSRFSQLNDVINWLDNDDDEIEKMNQSGTEVTPSRIEIALSTLCNTNYILERDGREFCFHPIGKLRQIEKDDEIYYKIFFTRVFFDGSLFRRFLLD